MNVLKSITTKNLNKNKKRTIVTILGISLSVALICAITTFIASFQNAMLERTKIKDGSYHIMVENITEEQEKYIENNAKVESIGYSKVLGYAEHKEIKNDYKPYLYIQAFDDESLKTRGLILSKGRFPENENEIVIPDHIITNGKVELKIGEKLNILLGKRIVQGEELNQINPYLSGEDGEEKEEFIGEIQKEYTIVGIIERAGFEDYSAPGYTAITKLENKETANEMSLTLKNPRRSI